MFGKILVPVDGSTQAKDALIKGLEIAKIHGSKVEILHVSTLSEKNFPFSSSETVSHSGNLMPPEWIKEYLENIRKNYENMLNEALKYAKQFTPKVDIETKLLIGRAAETILTEADEGKFDLIVIGSRGLGGLRELVLGSVSHSVVDGAKIPVLIVK